MEDRQDVEANRHGTWAAKARQCPKPVFTSVISIWFVLIVALPGCGALRSVPSAGVDPWETLTRESEDLFRAGDFAGALVKARQALKLAEDREPPRDGDLAVSMANVAGVYLLQGKYALAEPLYDRAVEIGEEALGPLHPDFMQILNQQAELYRETGRFSKAESLQTRVLEIRETEFGPKHPDVAESLNNLGLTYQMMGRLSDAEPRLQRALEIKEEGLEPDDPEVAKSLMNLASLRHEQGRDDDVERLFKRALSILEASRYPDHPNTGACLGNLAMVYVTQGDYDQAEPLMLRGLSIDERTLGPEHPYVASDLYNLADIYKATERLAQATPLYERALEIRAKEFGDDHWFVQEALMDLVIDYYRLENHDKVEALSKRLRGAVPTEEEAEQFRTLKEAANQDITICADLLRQDLPPLHYEEIFKDPEHLCHQRVVEVLEMLRASGDYRFHHVTFVSLGENPEFVRKTLLQGEKDEMAIMAASIAGRRLFQYADLVAEAVLSRTWETEETVRCGSDRWCTWSFALGEALLDLKADPVSELMAQALVATWEAANRSLELDPEGAQSLYPYYQDWWRKFTAETVELRGSQE